MSPIASLDVSTTRGEYHLIFDESMQIMHQRLRRLDHQVAKGRIKRFLEPRCRQPGKATAINPNNHPGAGEEAERVKVLHGAHLLVEHVRVHEAPHGFLALPLHDLSAYRAYAKIDGVSALAPLHGPIQKSR